MHPVRKPSPAFKGRGQGLGCVDSVLVKCQGHCGFRNESHGHPGQLGLPDPGAEGTGCRQAFPAAGSGGEGSWGPDDQRRLHPLRPDLAGVSRSGNGPTRVSGRRAARGPGTELLTALALPGGGAPSGHPPPTSPVPPPRCAPHQRPSPSPPGLVSKDGWSFDSENLGPRAGISKFPGTL